MRRRYMTYLHKPTKIPRTTAYRKRIAENQHEQQVDSTPKILHPGRSHHSTEDDSQSNCYEDTGATCLECVPQILESGPILAGTAGAPVLLEDGLSSPKAYSFVQSCPETDFPEEALKSNYDGDTAASDLKCVLQTLESCPVQSCTADTTVLSEDGLTFSKASPLQQPHEEDFEVPPLNCNNANKEEGSMFEETLCPCVSGTAGDVYLMTLAIGLRHNLPWAAQVDILKMVNAIFGRTVVQDTKHHYLKHVNSGTIDTNMNYYCPRCHILKISADFDQNGTCVCSCEETFSLDTAPYFISLSLEMQLRNLLKDADVSSALTGHRFNRVKEHEDAIEDVYDGLVYKKHCGAGGILSNQNNFSYCFNTDGVKAGKSCSKNRTMWPIYITINELPYLQRKRNVLLAGLYVGHIHPNMNSFLEPFVDQANELSEEGFLWTNAKGEEVNSKVIPLCAVVDSPARSSMLQMNSYSSLYGCTFCYQKTERTEKGRRFSGNHVGNLRTHDSMVKDMEIAFEKRNVRNKSERRHHGVWRPSVLMNLKYFDLVKGFVPEYMHCLLLGVVKQHTEILFDPQRKSKFWKNMEDDMGVEHLISLLDSYLSMITPPHCITRLPRSLSDRDLWKGSEWRSWLLFYSIVCLRDELKEKYLLHLSMLSAASNILLQKSVMPHELEYAEELILKYCFLYEEYFGPAAMNYCVHLLVHLVDGVRNMGPLWTHNAFLYEGQNRYLLQLMSSPRKLAVQLTTKYLTYASLANLCKKLASNENSIKFCENMTEKCLKFCHKFGSIILIGNGASFIPTFEESQCLSMNTVCAKSIKVFDKCICNQQRFNSCAYSVGKRNNSSAIATRNGKLLSIVHFLLCDNEPLILAREISLCESPLLHDDHVRVIHIARIDLQESSLVVIRPEDIYSHCIIMELTHESFLSKIPLGCYGD